ncbi:MAG: DUF1800 domain-containing protein [Vicinamibacterales bacterium]
MIQHVLRRMGFGASAEDLAAYADVPPLDLVHELLAFDRIPDTVDAQIGKPGYAGVTTRGGPFSPNTSIADARQRELFRMIHSRRPLAEKMALFWHNHFATAYSKVAGAIGQVQGARMMAARPEETPGGATGQYELFRRMGTGSFTDLLVAVAKDPAMLVWLDGRQNTKNRPQENFGRELMELFTTGIGHYTEDDVRAAARAFTGWNLQLVGDRSNPEASYYQFVFNQNQHDTAAKAFTFAIYPDGGQTMAARSGEAGLQDGLDLIAALARHPATARRLAGRLYAYFINEVDPPDDAVIDDLAATYLASGTSIRSVLQRLFTSPAFLDPANEFARYAWPLEFVVRSVREAGWTGFGVDTAITPLVNMGQQLFEPPDVNGWALGPAWFSTASMLARMNFASALMQNQKFNLGAAAAPYGQSPDRVLDYLLNRFTYAPIGQEVYDALLEYLQAGGWTGATSQLNDKAAGAARLIVASSEYQFN